MSFSAQQDFLLRRRDGGFSTVKRKDETLKAYEKRADSY
jgi:hypothetical protein